MEPRDKDIDYNLVKINRAEKRKDHPVIIRNIVTDQSNNKISAYTFIENNTAALSLLSVIFIPYVLGMLLTLVIFYFYIGVGIRDFFHAYSGLSQFVFWIFGIYIMVLLFDIWVITKNILFKANKRSYKGF